MKNIAFIADPFEKMKPHKDTTYALIRAALDLGHKVFHIDQDEIHLLNDKAFCQATEILKKDIPLATNKSELGLNDFDQIWIRKDPPFDRRYFYTTLMCDFTDESTKVLNKPQILRDWNEKLSGHNYPEYQPETLVSSKESKLTEFIDKHEEVVLKPVDGFGGKGIYFTKKEDTEKLSILKKVTKDFSEKVLAQKAVPEASLGDKRVLLFQGEVLGGILRVHGEDSRINNLDAGGTAQPTELSPRQKEISERLAKDFIEKGIYFAGIDFLGDYLIEINITSPTGLQELEKFSGKELAKKMISEA